MLSEESEERYDVLFEGEYKPITLIMMFNLFTANFGYFGLVFMIPYIL